MKLRLLCVSVAAVPLLALLATPAYAAVPGAPSAVAAALGPGRALVTWSAAADDGGAAPTGFHVYRVADGGTPVLLTTTTADATSYTDAGAPVGPLLSYGVAQVNADGAGEAAYTAAKRAPAGELVTRAWTGVDQEHTITGAVPGGPRFVDVAAGERPSGPAVSSDGAWLVYSRKVTADDSDDNHDLYVRRADGTGTARRLTFATTNDRDAVWSPDGKSIAYVRGDSDVYVIPAAGGTATKVAFGRTPAWLPDSRSLLIGTWNGNIRRYTPWVDGTTALPGTFAAQHLSVSPNGRWVAYTFEEDSTARRYLAIAPTDGSAAAKVLKEAGADVWDPTWRGDGRVVYASRMPFSGEFPVHTAAYSWDGVTLKKTADDVLASDVDAQPAYRAVGLRFTSAPHATRTTATVTFALTGPYTAATCSLDGGAATDCSSGTWSKSALKAGRHRLTVTATRAGYPSRTLAHWWAVDLTAPVLAGTTPTRSIVLGPDVVYGYGAVDDHAGVKSYDVRYRRARYDGAYTAWVSRTGWLGRTATTVSVPATPGYEYCFGFRARDRLGNVSAWHDEQCIAAPVDDRAFVASAGWSRATASGYYRSTYTQATAGGATLSLGGVTARQLVLVATTCSSCGSVTVYHAGVRLRTLDLRSSKTQRGVELWLPWQGTLRTGTVRLVVTRPGLVRVDGLGAIRP